MVGLSDEESTIVFIRDTIKTTTKQLPCISVSPLSTVDSIFKVIIDGFDYPEDTFELIVQNNSNGNTVVLNKYKEKTLSELNISFDPSERNSLMICALKKSKNMALAVNNEDDLLLGASASPTSGELVFTRSQIPRRMRMKDYHDDEAGGSWGEALNYVGLVNQAMTCYLNSLLQALYMTPEFRNALYNWEFDGKEEGKSIPFQLQKLFLNLQTSNRSAVETTELTRSFGWDMHEAWQQHDIQELCRVMFDALEHKFKDTRQANLINDLYEGKMLDYVKCLACGTEKSRDDTFLDIPLPVRPFGSQVAYNSVEEALRAFVQPETLDGNNQYHCEKCNKKCDAHKGLKFIKFPYLLTLHLKRFDFDYSTMHRIKLNDKVVFPDILNLNSFIPTATCDLENDAMKCDDCSTTDSGSALDEESCQVSDISSTVNGQDDNCQEDDEGIDVSSENHHQENEKNRLEVKGPYVYELFSIMIHSGSASGGHYYAYIKDFAKNSWFCFNDQTVSRITEDDIRKTYGGGPVRGYYSGAYSSSTNAYMLMYRQIDKERNCSAITIDEFPNHIKNLLQQMRDMEELDRVERERESDMFRGRAYCWHPLQNKLVDTKLCVSHDSLLSQAVWDLHQQFKLSGVLMEDCRLVSYNKQQNCIDCSFEGNDLRFCDIAEKVKISHIDWFLEIKQPDTEFQVYKSGGVNMKLYLINIETDEVDEPRNFRVNPDETVREIKERLVRLFYLDMHTIQIVQEVFNNELHYLDDDEAPLKFESSSSVYKLYVSNGLDEDSEKPFALSRLHKVIDRLVHTVTVEVILPETDISTLDSLSIPPLDFNQNLNKVDVNERVNARTSPQPSQIGETFGDQSNSEDSSLSDSDRTLVGDAPGDCIGLLSSSSNSPADMHGTSYIYDMSWDDSPPEMPSKTPNYYFKSSVVKTVCYDDDLVKSCTINVDKRTMLGRLKKYLEPIVGVPIDYFKVYVLVPYVVEWSRLSDTLATLKDGDRLVIKLGRVLRKDEFAVKIFYFTPNDTETFTFLFESIEAKGLTVGQLKKDVVFAAKKQHMLNLNSSRCRLRMKNGKNPGKVFQDELKFDDDITVPNTFELFIQDLKEEETVGSKQLCLFVRRWSPATLTLGPFDEVVLDDFTVSDLKTKLTELSSIPLDNLEVAYVKGTFPCDMNVLDIHSELDWNVNTSQLDGWIFDSSLFFYRDNREALKEMTVEQKKELNQKENTRLGKCSTKNYSPRRERPLKIYVLDSTPNKSDEACGD